MPRVGSRLAAVVLAAAGSLAVAQSPVTQPAGDAPRFTKTESAFVPFSRKVDFDKLAPVNVRVSIDGGRPLLLQVDTGSVGVMVNQANVPNVAPTPKKGAWSTPAAATGFTAIGCRSR